MAVFVRFLQKEFDVVRVKNRFNHDTVEKVWLRIWNQGARMQPRSKGRAVD